MSGTRSLFQRVIRVDRESMSTNQPVSALPTLAVRSNLQHLIDMAVQYRVSWAASTEEGGSGDPVITRFTWPFVTTIVDETTIPSFDLHIAARLTHVDVTAGVVRARLVSQWTLHEFDEIALSSTSVVTNNQHVDLVQPWEALATRIGAATAAGLASYRIVPMMLVVETESSDPDDGYAHVCGVQLREYLSQ
jgi:hypothetical protein